MPGTRGTLQAVADPRDLTITILALLELGSTLLYDPAAANELAPPLVPVGLVSFLMLETSR